MPSPYWQSQIEPMQRGIQTLGQTLAQAPRIRAQAALMQQRGGLYDQQAGEMAARTAGLNLDNDRKGFQNNLVSALVTRLGQPGAVAKTADGNWQISDDALQDVVGDVAGIGKDATDTASGVDKILTTKNAPNKPWAAPNNSTIMDGTNIIGQAGANIPSGDVRTGPADGTNAPPIVAVNPKPIISGTGATKQEIRQVVNPARVRGDAVYTNEPPFLSLTNLTSALTQGATNSPAVPSIPTQQSPVKAFTDKTGQRFIYTGGMVDPTQDKNPNNWQIAQ